MRPGPSLRPHVKAFKSTALARELVEAGHTGFCCATASEVIGMARAGLGGDLLLANETVDPARLRAMAELDVPVTLAVDSDATVDAAAATGITACSSTSTSGSPVVAARPAMRGGSPTELAVPASRCAASWDTKAT